MINSNINKRRIFQILSEVKLEQKLSKIFDEAHDDFDLNLLPIVIQCSFETMTAKFKHDCFQHNAHMNYLKPLPVLKQTLQMLCNKMDAIFVQHDQNYENPDNANQSFTCNQNTVELKQIMLTVSVLLECVAELQHQCMIYVEVSFINRFFVEHIFRVLGLQRLVQFAWICLNVIESDGNVEYLSVSCACLNHILRTQAIFNESNTFFISDESCTFFNRLLLALYEVVRTNLATKSMLERNRLKSIFSEQSRNSDKVDAVAELSYAKAVFLGVFVESCYNANDSAQTKLTTDSNHLNSFKETVLSLITSTLRSNSFYFFAITPREIINSFEWQHDSSNKTITFQSVPIDCLNEIEIVEKFLKR